MKQQINLPERHQALLRLAACVAPFPLPGPATRPRYTTGATSVAAAPLRQLLYRSQSAQAFSEEQLVDLLEEARAHNHQHGITGLLFHYDNQFVQFLEGDTVALTLLYDRIRQDHRHDQVRTLYEGESQTRLFAEWSMAFATPEPDEFYWLLDYLEAQQHRLLLPKIPITEPRLLALLSTLMQR